MTWTCIKEGQGGDESSELKIPRVKLTGQGRMPVVDMSKINASRCLSEPPRDSTCITGSGSLQYENVPRGLPPPHPTSPTHALYAQVNKSRKSSHNNMNNKHPVISNNTETANYSNLDFANSLPLYENSRDVLSHVPEMDSSRGSCGPEVVLPP